MQDSEDDKHAKEDVGLCGACLACVAALPGRACKLLWELGDEFAQALCYRHYERRYNESMRKDKETYMREVAARKEAAFGPVAKAAIEDTLQPAVEAYLNSLEQVRQLMLVAPAARHCDWSANPRHLFTVIKLRDTGIHSLSSCLLQIQQPTVVMSHPFACADTPRCAAACQGCTCLCAWGWRGWCPYAACQEALRYCEGCQ